MPDRATRGTQTLDRAVAVLKALAVRSVTGWRLTDLAAHCGLDNATAYRILQCLQRHRLARQHGSNRHYAPGPMLYELGLAFPALAEFQTAGRPTLARLARQLRGVAFLYLRSDEDFVCIARADAARLRGLSVDVGTRRPLALSAAGIAILLALPPEESERILQSNMVAVRRFGDVRVRAVEEAIRRSRRAGLGLILGDIVPGFWSFGVPVLDGGGFPFAALGATGRAENYSTEQIPRIAELLRKEARGIEKECTALIPEIAG